MSETPAGQRGDAAIHLVGYFEAAPANAEAALAALRANGAADARSGASSARLFREIARPNRFVSETVVADATDIGAMRAILVAGLDRLLIAPPDLRPHRRWLASPAAVQGGSDAVHVYTHVDVPPPCLEALQALLPPFVEASRREAGARRFDLLQSTERPNHQTLVETNFNISEAARRLGMHRRTLARKLEKRQVK